MAADVGIVDVVIMAAGKGTRMKSKLPKVLHPLAGRALVHHVLDTAAELGARSAVLITGHGAQEVEAACGSGGAGGVYGGSSSGRGSDGGGGGVGSVGSGAALPLQFVRQQPQLGTGHAVQQAVPVLPDDGIVVVLSGDVPLTQAQTLRELIALCGGEALALLTLQLEDPTGYGRIVREGAGDDAPVRAIV